MSRLIHLNGAPGVGKSTLAARYAADHPGVLVCDIDVLRTMVAGWEDDFHGAGARIRTAALAAISAYLRSGYDVVLPQLVGRRDELARFRAAAESTGSTYVGVLLRADPETVIARFRERGRRSDDPWARIVTDVVDGLGGDASIRDTAAGLEDLAEAEKLHLVEIADLETAYAALLACSRSSPSGTPSRRGR